VFYEGPNSPDARILKGPAEACAAVVERSNQLNVPIRFIESEQYQCGDKIFATHRVLGEFHSAGPFDVRAVDIYTFRGDRLARGDRPASKDTY
jgi:hypothetical protein